MDRTIFGRTALVLATSALVATPATASDETKTGILAGLGVAAATGKTSLGGSAGAIEAGMLSSDTYRQSARIVAGIVAQVVLPARPVVAGQAWDGAKRGGKVVLLGGADTIDLISPEIIRKQINDAIASLRSTANNGCPKKVEVPSDPEAGKTIYGAFPAAGGKTMKLFPADLAGAIITDTSISGLDLPKSDSRMTQALMMTRQSVATNIDEDGSWHSPTFGQRSTPLPMVIAGEAIGWQAPSQVRKDYDTLVEELGKRAASCEDKDGKPVANKPRLAAEKIATALAEGLIASKDGPSVLARAMQTEAFLGSDPIVVRTTVEQVGGTSIARSGVLYTFGWPNAATVSAGLIVSFRVVDPKAAKLLAMGEVRCLTPQINIKKMRARLGQENDEVACDYRTVRL